MKKLATAICVLLFIANTQAQSTRFSEKEFSINGFRNPSVGLEFRMKQMSVHAGYYPTAFKAGENTSFFKAGTTFWFLPVGQKENPSSFYAGVDYLRGFNRDYENKNAVGIEAGFRWMIWKGLNFRIGAIAVAGAGQSLKVNPTPGLSYSFFFKGKQK
ncbi:MAG: hypothetical protein WDO14_19920 [Bacteroidota bacterium]